MIDEAGSARHGPVGKRRWSRLPQGRGGDGGSRYPAKVLHASALTLLLLVGLAPFFMLFPLLPDVAGPDPTLPPACFWLATAVTGGTIGGFGGARWRQRLYRAAWVVLAASLLSTLVCRLLPTIELPLPHGLAVLLRLDGEGAQDATLYEAWLLAWLACFAAVLVCRHRLTRVRVAQGVMGRARPVDDLRSPALPSVAADP